MTCQLCGGELRNYGGWLGCQKCPWSGDSTPPLPRAAGGVEGGA